MEIEQTESESTINVFRKYHNDCAGALCNGKLIDQLFVLVERIAKYNLYCPTQSVSRRTSERNIHQNSKANFFKGEPSTARQHY